MSDNQYPNKKMKSIFTHSKRTWLVCSLIITLAFVASNSLPFMRAVFKLITNQSLLVSNRSIDLLPHFFVVKKSEVDETFMIGNFGAGDELLPLASFITVGSYSNMSGNGIEWLLAKCASRTCTDTKSILLAGVDCLQFIDPKGYARANQIFNFMCPLGNAKLIAEFHGEQSKFDLFRPQMEVILKQLSATNNSTTTSLM